MAVTGPESVLFYRFIDTKKNEKSSAILDRANLVMRLFKKGAERYVRKVDKLLHFKNINKETIQDILKIVTSRSELIRRTLQPDA